MKRVLPANPTESVRDDRLFPLFVFLPYPQILVETRKEIPVVAAVRAKPAIDCLNRHLSHLTRLSDGPRIFSCQKMLGYMDPPRHHQLFTGSEEIEEESEILLRLNAAKRAQKLLPETVTLRFWEVRRAYFADSHTPILPCKKCMY